MGGFCPGVSGQPCPDCPGPVWSGRPSIRKGGFVGFGVMQAESDSVSLRVPFTAPSAARVRRELRDWMVAQGLSRDLVEDARVVVSELVGNSVRHAHPLPNNDIVVRWWLEEDALDRKRV